MKSYKRTLYASYLGYITQAIINNLSPLLFITFQTQFNLSLSSITLLITINFIVQIITDIIACQIVDKLGYKPCIIAAHIFSTIGLVGLGIFPYLFSNAYAGLLLATILNAIGGGLIEVLVSPIVEALPGDEKASAMSLLHSFYCWGHVAVVLISTAYFTLVGINHWFYLPLLWALLPLCNAFLYLHAPIAVLVEEHEKTPLRKLLSSRLLLLFLLLMICSGASEQAMSQWSSLFAEMGLQVNKTVGDLLGPCAFALLMGTSRAIYGNKGSSLNLEKTMIASSLLCIFSYLLCVFSPQPLLSLVGCSLCGFSVGILWPGTFSLSVKYFKKGGTSLFALLALAGDIGCSIGPSLVGYISDFVTRSTPNLNTSLFRQDTLEQFGLKVGLFAAILFPFLMAIAVYYLLIRQRKNA